VEVALKPRAEATVLKAGRRLPTVLEQPEIGDETKRGIEALFGSLVNIAPALEVQTN